MALAARRTGMRVATAVLGLALVGSACQGDTVGTRTPPILYSSPTPAGNFTLYVSNQSFDRPTVDIAVVIDGVGRVSQNFEVKNQHVWIPFTFDLTRGSHELRVSSARGKTTLVKSFLIGTHRWGVLNYWCCDPAFDEPRFIFDVLDRAPSFG